MKSRLGFSCLILIKPKKQSKAEHGIAFEGPEHNVMSVLQYSCFSHEETICASKNLNAHCFILAFTGFRKFSRKHCFCELCGGGQILKPLDSLF